MDNNRVLALNDRVDAIFATAKVANRDLTPVESAEVGAIASEFQRMQHEDDAPFPRRTEPDTVAAAMPAVTRYADAPVLPHGVHGRKSARDIFGAAGDDRCGFASFSDFVRCVGTGLHH